MTIDTTLPANDPLRFRIYLFDAYVFKNTNCKATYKNDRKVAKISALSSNKFDKYEYLTGDDLGLKPSTIEQT